MIGYYLTHPQVDIDRAVPVPQWRLSTKGAERIRSLTSRPWLATIRRIVSSEERKATETAGILAASLGIGFEAYDDFGENDRSATDFLEPVAFEAAANQFFAHPEQSWHGWERAVDASHRIVGAVERVLNSHDAAMPILFVGHGAVGTLLKCHMAGHPISRLEDQPGGGGNLFAFRLSDRALLSEWTPLEQFDGAFDVA